MSVQLQPEKTGPINGYAEPIIRTAILAIALLLLTRNVTGLFTGWHEDNSALYSIFARNHIQYGLGYTKLFNTWGDTLTPPTEPHRYLHHPPLVAVWPVIPMLFFGDHEWAARLAPIATTLGSVWLLMVIVSRLQSPLLGLLSGFFYATLPITAYFGRVIDPESPVQFFSLLILHGYLQWAGLYGNSYRRAPGAICYTLGAFLGIATGWATFIMTGLIWLWHLLRSLRDSSVRRLLVYLTLIPGVSLTAVVVHLLWGYGWSTAWLLPLLSTRSLSPEDPIPWTKWLYMNLAHLNTNISMFGAGAAVIYLAIVPLILRYASLNSPLRQILRSKTSVAPILLTGLHGLIWVVLFKRQSAFCDYWQYFTSPFFAVAMASVVLTIFTLLSRLVSKIAIWAVILLVMLPMPFFANYLDVLHQRRLPQSMCDILTIFEELGQLVPARVPAMISEEYPQPESENRYTGLMANSFLAYYINRPLIYSTDINEIQANQRGCAAYVMLLTNDPNLLELARELNARYKLAWAHQNFLIFLLNQSPKDN